MASETTTTDKNTADPFAHERGLGEGMDNVEDPLGEYRNEGFGRDKGWHQGGDFGAGSAANLGRSAGEVELEDSADDTGAQKADENKKHQDGADKDSAGSQGNASPQAPGSNTSSTSTGVVSDPDQK